MIGTFTVNYSTKEVFTNGRWRTRYIASAEVKGRKDPVKAMSDESHDEAKEKVMTQLRDIKQSDIIVI
jgi:hypothetical protein